MTVDLNNLRIAHRTDAPPSRGRGAILLALLLLPAGVALGWFLRGDAPDLFGRAVEVRTEVLRADGGPAGRPSASGAFSEGGWIEVPSYHPIVVSALVPGRIEELSVLEGSPVAEGQSIARLYAKDLADDLRLAEAEAATARAELELLEAGYRPEDVARAGHEVERLVREAEVLKRVAERTRSLLPSGAASEEELERDLAAARAAEAAAAAARAEHEKLSAGYRTEEIEKAKAVLARAEAARDLAARRLSYAEVKSPAAGVVYQRFVTPGTHLTDGDLRVVSLYDPRDLQARVDVRQENAGRIRIGQPVEIETDAEPGRKYRGTVIRVEPMADLRKNTVQAKVRIEDPGPGLHPEMICRARFLAPEEPAGAESAAPAAAPRPTAPASAILVDGGRSFVFTVRDGVARRIEIRPGERTGDRVVLEAGPAAGTTIVVDPPAGLADGDAVKEMR